MPLRKSPELKRPSRWWCWFRLSAWWARWCLAACGLGGVCAAPYEVDPLSELPRWSRPEAFEGLQLSFLRVAPSGELCAVSGRNALHLYDGLRLTEVVPPDGVELAFISGFQVTSRGDWVLQTREGIILRQGNDWRMVAPGGRPRRAQEAIVETADGHLWVGAAQGLWRIDPGTHEAHFASTGQSVLSLAEGPGAGSLWVALAPFGEIWEVAVDAAGIAPRETWQQVRGPMAEELLEASLWRARDGRIYYINNHHNLPPAVYDPATGAWVDINLTLLGGDNYDFAILETRDGAIWISSRGALHVLRNDRWTVYRSPEYPLPGARSLLAEDASGAVYLAESGGITLRIDYARQRGRSFAGLHYQGTTADGTEVFLAVDGAVVAWPTGSESPTVTPPTETGLGQPTALKVLANGDWFLVGTSEGAAAVAIRTASGWRANRFPGVALSFGHLGVLERANGEIWVGCAQMPEEFPELEGGVVVFRRLSDGAYAFEHRRPPAVPFRNWSMREGPDGWVYVSGNGLMRTDGARAVELALPEALEGKWIDQIAIGPDGALWAACWGAGVFRWADGKWTDETARGGLDSLFVSYVHINRAGDPLVATREAMYRYDGQRWSPAMAHQAGLHRGSGQLVEGPEGRIWVNRTHVDWYYRGQRAEDYAASKRGGFRTMEYRPDREPPETFWRRPPPELVGSGAFLVEWDGRDAWGVTPSEAIEFSYRLDRGPWSPFLPERSHTFQDLRGGRHTLEVRARDADGNMDPTPLAARLRVVVPLWRQGWFIALGVGLIVLIAVAITLFIRQRVRHLLELEQVKLRVFTHLSHEIKTPLTLILGPVERLQNEIPDGAHQHLLSLIKTNSQRLLFLVNQLLDFRKFQLSKLDFQPERADFVPFSRQCIEVFQSWARENAKELTYECTVPRLVFRFDQELFHKIIDNLVNNAVKYSPEGGRITVRVGRREEDSGPAVGILEVEDNGPGIPAREQERVFEPFYRGEEQQDEHEGSGIGLALVRELVGVIEGTITIESPVAGQPGGTCFRVRFPLLDEGAAPAPAEAGEPTEVAATTEATGQGEGEGGLVLLVEDNRDLRDFLASELRPSFQVLTAASAEEGLKMARAHMPDLVLSDVVMTGGDGFGLCRALKDAFETSHIPVVLLTALRSDEHKRRAFESRADDFLTKPVSGYLLRLKLRNLLETQRHTRERLRQQFFGEQRMSGLPAADQAFLDQVDALVEAKLGEEQFEVSALAREVGMSRSAFYRKFNSLTDLSPAVFIKTKRLRRAAQWLAEGGRNVTEVAFGVGFSDTGYFSRVFKEEFQCTPSEFAKRSRQIGSAEAN